MSQHKKLKQVLEFLINEEIGQAEELLHDIVVGKARTIYEGLVNDEEAEEEVEEAFGGDVKDDFIGEVDIDKDEIEGDEIADGEAEEYGIESGEENGEEGDEFGFGGEEEELSTEDKVEELEVQLAELKAEFDVLMGQELEEPNHEPGDFGIEPEGEIAFGGEEEYASGPEDDMEYVSRLGEATKLQDPVADPGMSKEGKLAGTGKNSKIGAVGKESPYTHAPGKTVDTANPVDFTKGGDEKGGKGESAKDDTPSDNIGEEPKNFSHGEQKTEGDPVGTGKNTKKGAVNTKSPLSSAPKHP